jgi:hypothetical protein
MLLLLLVMVVMVMMELPRKQTFAPNTGSVCVWWIRAVIKKHKARISRLHWLVKIHLLSPQRSSLTCRMTKAEQ